jgi:hypothetical protein
MWIVGVLVSLALIILILVDSFETTVQPRRVTHRFRFARLFYRTTWSFWRVLALRMPTGRIREAFLSWFGPASLLALLVVWVFGLILGFALLHWSLATRFQSGEAATAFGTYVYWSGGTFFTLGYGDLTPVTALGRALAVTEAGMGFGFLALIIGYLPVIHQEFARRELAIALLDARAGSPPSAAQLLLRLARSRSFATVDPFLAEWERWAAELLESHLSFPLLSFYRSQHDNQSWLAALTVVLDTCAFFIAKVKEHCPFQAQLTFAMARHAAVDLALIFRTAPVALRRDRLSGDTLHAFQTQLRDAGMQVDTSSAADAKLTELRVMYEPFVNALTARFLFALPAFVPDKVEADNWQRSAWMPRPPGINRLPVITDGNEHFN